MDAKAQSMPTETLWKLLRETPSLSDYLVRHENELSTPVYSAFITAICRQRGEPPERIIQRAGIERSFGHQLFKGTRHPSRDTAILLAFGFQADIELTQAMLRYAQHSPLYPRNPRDAAIIYAIFHRYGVVETQLMLTERNMRTMGYARAERVRP